jgi:hypothetical protein
MSSKAQSESPPFHAAHPKDDDRHRSANLVERDKLIQSQEEEFHRRLIHEMAEFNRRIESGMAASNQQLSEEVALRAR